MISFTCEHCGRAVRVKDTSAGKRGRCPHCEAMLHIPGRSEELEALAAALAGEQAAPSASVPPPPALQETPTEEDLFEMAGPAGADLCDTVILPAEGDASTVQPTPPPHVARLSRHPAINSRRTVVIVLAAIVVLAVALAAFLVLGSR